MVSTADHVSMITQPINKSVTGTLKVAAAESFPEDAGDVGFRLSLTTAAIITATPTSTATMARGDAVRLGLMAGTLLESACAM